MKVLVACEESQRVFTAFRECGHFAYLSVLKYCSVVPIGILVVICRQVLEDNSWDLIDKQWSI